MEEGGRDKLWRREGETKAASPKAASPKAHNWRVKSQG